MERLLGWLTSEDVRIFSFVNQQLQCRVLDMVLPKLTHLGGAAFILVSLLLLVFSLYGTPRIWAIEALFSLCASHLVVRVMKKRYLRPRPYITLPNTRIFPNPLMDYSFPSGHTTASFSVAVAFSLHSILLTFLLMPLAIIVGFSRVYLGLHYPTDCAIGAAVGCFSSLLVVYGSTFLLS
ncbi:MAG: phosphatase PAP2 family protein [Bacillota bacterium]